VVRLSNVQIIVVITTIVLLAIFTWLVARTRLAVTCAPANRTRPWRRSWRRRRPHHLHDVCHWRRARRRRGHDVLLYFGLVDFFMGFVAGIKAFTARCSAASARCPARAGRAVDRADRDTWSAYFSVEYKDVAAFSIPDHRADFPPHGLLGRPEVEKFDRALA